MNRLNSGPDQALQENQIFQIQMQLEGSKEKLEDDLCICSLYYFCILTEAHRITSLSATVYVHNDIHLIVDFKCAFSFDYGKDLSIIHVVIGVLVVTLITVVVIPKSS